MYLSLHRDVSHCERNCAKVPMITLYTFGRRFGLPDASPFVMKAEVLLKMSGLEFRCVAGGLRGAPKGKLPFIDDDGVKLADSTFIRFHLEQRHRIDFDAHLTPEQQGVAWACEKMLEDHLYWAVLHWRWIDEVSFAKGPATFFDIVPAPLRPLVRRMVRNSVRKNLHAHGLGRHSVEEINLLGKRDLDALASILGNKPYLMGALRCGADATLFAFVAGVLCKHFDNPLRTHAERHANLVAYNERMMHEFYPELAAPK
jgi:glutathione S-transferase